MEALRLEELETKRQKEETRRLLMQEINEHNAKSLKGDTSTSTGERQEMPYFSATDIYTRTAAERQNVSDACYLPRMLVDGASVRWSFLQSANYLKTVRPPCE